MNLLVDLLLLLAALMLVLRSNSERDEVWALCLRVLAAVAVLAVITNDRGQPLAILLLLLALWLPAASRYEKLPPPRRVGRVINKDGPDLLEMVFVALVLAGIAYSFTH